MKKCEFMTPERVIFGQGEINRLGACVKDLRSEKVFIVTDKIVAGLDIFKDVEKSLAQMNIEYYKYTDVDPNPTDNQVEKGAELFKAQGADCIIAVGGGSSMDSAKAIGILASNGGSIHDYCLGPGAEFTETKKLVKPMPSLITVPTTSGTGAEVTGYAVITNTKENYKFIPGGWESLPKIVIVDPLMSASMPSVVTGATGMDALSHAIEAITSPYAMPQTDAFAFSAIELIIKYLGPAVADGSNIEAREGMAMAAMEAGLSMNAWCGAVHALGHQLSTQFGMPHGMAMGLMMPIVMEFNIIACPDRYSQIAVAMGEKVEGLGPMEAARKAPEAVRNLQKSIGLPTSLKEYGADPEKISECAKWTITDPDMDGNPRTISLEQAEELFRKAFED